MFKAFRRKPVETAEAQLAPFRRLVGEDLLLLANADGPVVLQEIGSGETVFMAWSDASWAEEWYSGHVATPGWDLPPEHRLDTVSATKVAGMALDLEVDTLTVWGFGGERTIFEVQ